MTDNDDRITVLIADDDLPFLALLSETIEQDGRFKLLHPQAVTSEHAASLAEELRPDVCVLDWHMPLVGGVGSSRMIREKGIDTSIVILTGYADILADVTAADEAGLDAVELKTGKDWPQSFLDKLVEVVEVRQQARARPPERT